jgi:cell division protein FtsL
VTQPGKEPQRSQRGAGKLKAIIYTAILVVGVFMAFKIVPLYVANYQLKDKMAEQARFAVVNRYSDDQVRDVIYKTVQDLDIPAKREDIKVEHTSHGLRISLDYTAPVDFMVYQTDWNFATSGDAIDIMK